MSKEKNYEFTNFKDAKNKIRKIPDTFDTLILPLCEEDATAATVAGYFAVIPPHITGLNLSRFFIEPENNWLDFLKTQIPKCVTRLNFQGKQFTKKESILAFLRAIPDHVTELDLSRTNIFSVYQREENILENQWGLTPLIPLLIPTPPAYFFCFSFLGI